ncbi:hypothetical protein K439DRAFT_1619185 [Ramaria rubella]|nr:hypothetical protein K439DRAFT_1619185 [Ramaria rubella]
MAPIPRPDTTILDRELACKHVHAIFGIQDVYDWQLEACVRHTHWWWHDTYLLSAITAFLAPANPANTKTILVVSPLVELMKEQATDRNSRCIPAVVICAEAMDLGDPIQVAAKEPASGQVHIGFISPEILHNGMFHAKFTFQFGATKNLLAVFICLIHLLVFSRQTVFDGMLAFADKWSTSFDLQW